MITQYTVIEWSDPSKKQGGTYTNNTLCNSVKFHIFYFNHQIKLHFAPNHFSSLCCWDYPLSETCQVRCSIDGITPFGDNCEPNSAAGISPTQSSMLACSADGISLSRRRQHEHPPTTPSWLAYRQSKPFVMGLSPARRLYSTAEIFSSQSS